MTEQIFLGLSIIQYQFGERVTFSYDSRTIFILILINQIKECELA